MSCFAPDLTEDALLRLIARSEGHLLDFKRAHFPSTLPHRERDRKHGELIKDILAFANTRRTQPAYIIVGVSDDKRLIGIPDSRDDATFQMMFRDKANRTPVFRYYEIVLRADMRIGIVEISADQPRPIYLKNSFGPISECAVYIRQGSTNAALEPDRWRELYPLPPSGATATSSKNGVRELVERWVGLFDAHGVKHHQIQSLLPDHYLPLPALADWNQTATLLDNRMLDDTCRLFNVRRDWLAGDCDNVYDHFSLLYDVRGLLRILADWVPTCEEIAMLGFREDRKPLEEQPHQRCAFMLRGTIREFGEKPVFKYQPLYTEFDWDYDKGRTIAKVAWLAARLTGCTSWGWVLPRDAISSLSGGYVLPDIILKHAWAAAWHPEDFTFPASESAVAKEVHEFPQIVELARRERVVARALAIRLKKPDSAQDEWCSQLQSGRSDFIDGKLDDRDRPIP